MADHCAHDSTAGPDKFLWFTVVSVALLYFLGLLLPHGSGGVLQFSTLAHGVVELFNKMWWGLALGVVFVPAQNVCYYGVSGQGAYRIDRAGDGTGTAVPIKVTAPAARPLRVVGSRSHAGPELQTYVDNLGEHELVAKGSSLKFCLVAEGSADVYPRFGPTSEWDTAAAQAVVEAAGGRVCTLSGDDLSYNAKESILNPPFLVFGDPGRDWLRPLPK